MLSIYVLIFNKSAVSITPGGFKEIGSSDKPNILQIMTTDHRPHKKLKVVSRSIPRSTIIPQHPLKVKPSANEYFRSQAKGGVTVTQQLGRFSCFTDELIMDFLSYLTDPKDLLNLSHTSRVWYAYIYDEELWRKLYTRKFLQEEKRHVSENKGLPEHPLGIRKWGGSWRRTMLQFDSSIPDATVSCDDIVFSDLLYRPFQCSQVDYSKLFDKIIEEEKVSYDCGSKGVSIELEGRIKRVAESEMSTQKFNEEWINTPFILTNEDPHRWPRWDLKYLVKRFAKIKFRQEAVRWPLELYADYFENNHDESPLYLFDCASQAMKELVREYIVPSCFQQDLFRLFDESTSSSHPKISCRPDHAWLIVGPKNSGSTFHKDPNRTSAWNAAISGRKLWIMFPPGIQPPGVGTDEEESEVTSPVGIAEWVLSGFFNDAVKLSEVGDCLIGITHPGETMYVPSGWWHSVINIDDSVAITQNFSPLPTLRQTLDFFKNKSYQISGFRPGAVKSSLEALVGRIEDSSSENLPVFKKYLERLHNESSHLDEEDCGEIVAKTDEKMPIYEMFTELLVLNGYGEELTSAMADIQKLVEHANKENIIGEKSKWDKLTESTGGASFSFGFGFEAENSDDE